MVCLRTSFLDASHPGAPALVPVLPASWRAAPEGKISPGDMIPLVLPLGREAGPTRGLQVPCGELACGPAGPPAGSYTERSVLGVLPAE